MTSCSLDESLGEFTVQYLNLLPEYEDHQIENVREVELFIDVLNWLGIK